MTDRRRHRRFLLPHATAEIRLLQDVILETMGPEHVWVIAHSPGAAGEDLLLHISGRSGRVQTMTVRTADSMPLLMDRSVRHRLRLSVLRLTTLSSPFGAATGDVWAHDEAIASVLVRRASARVLDVSVRGCLLEMSAAVVPGTSALLDIDVDGAPYIEMVRVSRTAPATGSSSRCRVGAEFLPTFEAASRSIRPFVAKLEARHAGLAVARTPGRER